MRDILQEYKFTYHLDEEGVTHKIDKITGWLDEIDIVDDKMIYLKMANWLNLKRERSLSTITNSWDTPRMKTEIWS